MALLVRVRGYNSQVSAELNVQQEDAADADAHASAERGNEVVSGRSQLQMQRRGGGARLAGW